MLWSYKVTDELRDPHGTGVVREGGLVTATSGGTPHARQRQRRGGPSRSGKSFPKPRFATLQNQSFWIFVWSRYRALSVQSCVKKEAEPSFVLTTTICFNSTLS
jgi:hypothetical protein